MLKVRRDRRTGRRTNGMQCLTFLYRCGVITNRHGNGIWNDKSQQAHIKSVEK